MRTTTGFPPRLVDMWWDWRAILVINSLLLSFFFFIFYSISILIIIERKELEMKREQEIKLILQEKNKQIELIKQTEKEKNVITDSLK